MASNDHDERLWGALAVVALVVCVLNLRKTATSQDLSRVGSDFGRGLVVVVVVSHIQRIGCQPEKNYFTRWPIPLVVC